MRIGRLEHMFNRVTVIFATLQRDGTIRTDVVRMLRERNGIRVDAFLPGMEPEHIGDLKLKEPTWLMITGYGVIRKEFQEEDADGMERVIGDEDFIWERTVMRGGKVVMCFTRRDRVSPLKEKLEEYQIPILETCLWGTREGEGGSLQEEEEIRMAAVDLAERFYREGVAWKEFVKGDTRGDLLAGLLAGRLKLVLLSCLLGLLMINYLWNSSVREKYAVQQLEIASLEQDASSREKLSKDMERVIREFKESGTGSMSLVLDRVAAIVPPEVNLKTLLVNPLVKSLEEGKSVVTREGYIELTGVTGDAAKVTVFTGKLSGLDFTREVKLVSLDRNRETGLFEFKVLIGL